MRKITTGNSNLERSRHRQISALRYSASIGNRSIAKKRMLAIHQASFPSLLFFVFLARSRIVERSFVSNCFSFPRLQTFFSLRNRFFINQKYAMAEKSAELEACGVDLQVMRSKDVSSCVVSALSHNFIIRKMFLPWHLNQSRSGYKCWRHS